MAKEEVYSWRLSAETKTALEERARQNQSSVSELLNRIVGEWLIRQRQTNKDEGEQQRLHQAALKTVGAFEGNDAERAANAKGLVRNRLAKKRCAS